MKQRKRERRTPRCRPGGAAPRSAAGRETSALRRCPASARTPARPRATGSGAPDRAASRPRRGSSLRPQRLHRAHQHVGGRAEHHGAERRREVRRQRRAPQVERAAQRHAGTLGASNATPISVHADASIAGTIAPRRRRVAASSRADTPACAPSQKRKSDDTKPPASCAADASEQDPNRCLPQRQPSFARAPPTAQSSCARKRSSAALTCVGLVLAAPSDRRRAASATRAGSGRARGMRSSAPLLHDEHRIALAGDEQRRLLDLRAGERGVRSQVRSKLRYQLIGPRKPLCSNCARVDDRGRPRSATPAALSLSRIVSSSLLLVGCGDERAALAARSPDAE